MSRKMAILARPALDRSGRHASWPMPETHCAGRPAKLSADDVAMARKLLKDGETFDDLMRRFKVSRATLYNTGIRRHEPTPVKAKSKPRAARPRRRSGR